MIGVKSRVLCLLLIVLKVLFATQAAWAQQQGVTSLAAKSAAVAPDPVNRALKALEGTFDSTGTVAKGMLASDQPGLATAGVRECKLVANQKFLVCDIRETGTGAGQSATWDGHLVIGWDPATKLYRGVIADSEGNLRVVQGRSDQQKLTWQPISAVVGKSHPYENRVTFDFRNDNEIHMTNELRRGKKWIVLEMKVLKRRSQ
jgi:hypothetical protein